MRKTDFLIVGQGIAGTCVAHALQQRGKDLIVIDLPTENNSSVVAGGICNPITGNNLSLTWEADGIFEVLAPFYRSFETVLGEQFFQALPFYRRFYTIESQNQFYVKLANENFAKFVEEVPDERYKPWIDSPLGGWQTRFSGFVQVGKLLTKYRAYLQEREAFIEQRFDYEALQVGDSYLRWNDIEANYIIFCEGLQARQNPFFPHLPFNPNKGEWVKIRIEEPYTCPAILKQGVFFLPLGEGVYQVGATYHQTPLDNTPSEVGKTELLTQLQEWLKVPFEIIAQGAGIRPATRNRRPIVTWHETHQHIGILTGLGSKGVSLAPYLTMQLLAKI